MPAINLNHVSVVARNLRESVRFYEEVFGMQRVPTPNFGFPVQWPDAIWEQELGQAMFQLNIDAVHDRYGAGEAATFRGMTYSYRPALALSEGVGRLSMTVFPFWSCVLRAVRYLQFLLIRFHCPATLLAASPPPGRAPERPRTPRRPMSSR
jgi:hypothetical protein